MRFTIPPLLAALGLLSLPLALKLPLSASTELEEVHQLLGTHLPALGTNDLASTSVDDLVTRLTPRVRWVTATVDPAESGEVILATRRFPGDNGYVRLGHVTGDVASRLNEAVETLAMDRALRGLVIDLRFAEGRDFAASAQASALFFPSGTPVLDWGDGAFTAPEKTNRFSGPLALLVNSATRGSAEALAASLRHAGLAVVIGGTTAGEATLTRDFVLTSGRSLRLAVAPVKAGDGTPIAPDGLVPDIQVSATAESERRFLADPFAAATPASAPTGDLGASTQVKRRLTEAELIRSKRQALGQPDPATADPDPKPPAPADANRVQDPVLARGLDLLTGLNAVRE